MVHILVNIFTFHSLSSIKLPNYIVPERLMIQNQSNCLKKPCEILQITQQIYNLITKLRRHICNKNRKNNFEEQWDKGQTDILTIYPQRINEFYKTISSVNLY